MQYVFPHCSAKENEIKKIQGISRLFAYPAKPHFENNGQIVILDSGAYGLSLQGKSINEKYMKKLSEHYQKFRQKNTLCIAPDVYLNPCQSMMNMRTWNKRGYFKDVTAVLQCEKERFVDLPSLLYQAKFYKAYSSTICFSNPNLNGEQALYFKDELEELFKYCKSLGFIWIHNLGAGWDVEDIKKWKTIKYLDSMDSIAYYNDGNALENLKLFREAIKDEF